MDNEECDIVNTTGTCLSWINCTSTGYIANWTEQSCQPEPVKRYKHLMLTSLGIVGIVDISLNLLVLSTFLYLYFCKDRIKQKFYREFSLTNNPLIILVSHLCFCDLLYAFVGVPSYVWVNSMKCPVILNNWYSFLVWFTPMGTFLYHMTSVALLSSSETL